MASTTPRCKPMSVTNCTWIHAGKRNVSAPANPGGINKPLLNLPDWANNEADHFRKSCVMARSPGKSLECEGRQHNDTQVGEESGPKASEVQKRVS